MEEWLWLIFGPDFGQLWMRNFARSIKIGTDFFRLFESGRRQISQISKLSLLQLSPSLSSLPPAPFSKKIILCAVLDPPNVELQQGCLDAEDGLTL